MEISSVTKSLKVKLHKTCIKNRYMFITDFHYEDEDLSFFATATWLPISLGCTKRSLFRGHPMCKID